MSKTRITRLDSGLTVVTDAMAHLETASIGVWVGAGSRDEREHEHGLSHLLEHMAFKGTRRRSAKAISEEIEQVGGDLNAATSVEQTAYYARVLAADVGLALDIIADILTESVFDAEELEREKAVIVQEIGAVEDTPDDLVFDMFGLAAFPDQPIGRPILGTRERVSAFDRGAIGAYLDAHYVTGATVIAAAGAVDHDAVVEIASRLFTPFAARPAPAAAAARYAGGDARHKRRLEQAHIVFGFEGKSFRDPDVYAALVFANAAGGGMSSRLFQEIREERGLAYAIHASHWSLSDTGLFSVYAGAGGRDVPELCNVALDCLAQATVDLTETEVARARAQMKVSLLAALESSGARAEQMARQLLAHGRLVPREEAVAKIDAVDVAAARRAGRAMLAGRPTIAAIGPVARAPDPDRIAARIAGV
ncbi:MAG: insulinase family protein [Methylobacteriaceae bacterium]|nr:insulinase family protein [Methylobacteriaceae bacterium]